MTTEEFLTEVADVEFRKSTGGDPVLEEWTLSPEGEILRFANEVLAGEESALSRIEGQRFIG